MLPKFSSGQCSFPVASGVMTAILFGVVSLGWMHLGKVRKVLFKLFLEAVIMSRSVRNERDLGLRGPEISGATWMLGSHDPVVPSISYQICTILGDVGGS